MDYVHVIAYCLSSDVSTTFTEVVLEACLLPTILPDKFGLDYTMLVAIMHSQIGSEIGEYITNRKIHAFIRICTIIIKQGGSHK